MNQFPNVVCSILMYHTSELRISKAYSSYASCCLLNESNFSLTSGIYQQKTRKSKIVDKTCRVTWYISRKWCTKCLSAYTSDNVKVCVLFIGCRQAFHASVESTTDNYHQHRDIIVIIPLRFWKVDVDVTETLSNELFNCCFPVVIWYFIRASYIMYSFA